MKSKIFIFILFVFFLNLQLLSEDRIYVSDYKYIIIQNDDRTLNIMDMETSRMKEIKFKCEIDEIQTCISFPYINIRLKYESPSKGFYDYENILYDIENDIKYKEGTLIFQNEKRWSDNGELTYLHSCPCDFLIIRTANLIKFLKTNDESLIIAKIKVGELANIEQKYWQGNLLVYGTFCCDSGALGMLDTRTLKNYLLGITGFIYSPLSIKLRELNSGNIQKIVGKQLLKLKKANKLKQISFDVSQSLSEVIKKTPTFMKGKSIIYSFDKHNTKRVLFKYDRYIEKFCRKNRILTRNNEKKKTVFIYDSGNKEEIDIKKIKEPELYVAFNGKSKPLIIKEIKDIKELIRKLKDYFLEKDLKIENKKQKSFDKVVKKSINKKIK